MHDLSTYLTLAFALFATLVLPLGAGLFVSIKYKAWKSVLWGVLCFLVFQMFTRIPLISYLSALSAPWQLFSASQPVLYLLILALTAGLFEEIGRYIIMRRFMKKLDFSDGIAFGIGHGGIEALGLVGVNYLYAMIVRGPLWEAFSESSTLVMWGSFERISAMVLQVGFSVMIWQSVRLKKPIYLFLAILLHAAVDFAAPFLMMTGSAVWLVEIVVAAFALLLLGYVLFVRKRAGAEPETRIENENEEVEN